MKATWIWYPGDFEVWLGNRFNNRRTERGAMFPPFWKQDSHWPTVVFTKAIELDKEESVSIFAEGQFNISIDGHLRPSQPSFCVPAGRHTLAVKVWNQATPPALFITGAHVVTDATWQVTYEDKIWIDEEGVAHGAGVYVPVGCWNFNSVNTPPSQYHLERRRMLPVSSEATGDGTLYDFGREVFGYLNVEGLKGTICIYYGESREEALDKEHCETLDVLTPLSDTPQVRSDSKAFRYVYIVKEADAGYDDVSMDYEYAPFDTKKSGSFRCSDDELNRIWEVSAYTLDLTTREFFCDGIKRDRWVWSGDAIQSYLMNYYLHFDADCVKRTIRQLRGKDPVTAHINTIMDYTFYWFKSIMDYYLYTGDVAFVREIWPKMVTLMDFVLRRTNADCMAEGKPDDWIFVDWTDFPMHKRGTLCFEQILFWKSIEVMLCMASTIYNSTDDAEEKELLTDCFNRYMIISNSLTAKIRELFYDEKKGAFLHAIEDEKLNRQVTKFPNLFAILYNFATDEEGNSILKNVLLKHDVPPITTPYMRFYELETFCMFGLEKYVLNEIKSYWGGMLREGATTFWEKYNPDEHGTEHLAMYGRPYGKSLCHAWGASPLYLIGKYFLGVRPTKPGYEEYEVEPVLGGLDWMEGDVPTPRGMIHVSMNKDMVTVTSDFPGGTLIVADKKTPILAHQNNTIRL